MSAKTRHVVLRLAAATVMLPAILVLVDALQPLGAHVPWRWIAASSAAALIFGLPAAVLAVSEMQGVLRAFDRLRGFVVMMQTDDTDTLSRFSVEELPRETRRLFDAIESLLGGRLAQQALPVRQLEMVLGALPDAIVVINRSGQVGLVNGAARSLLGADVVAVGTSIYDALSSTEVAAKLERAREEGGAVETTFQSVDGRRLAARVVGVGEDRGAILLFHAPETTVDRAMDHDLALLELPPEPRPFSHDTPLADLPIFVFDLETTGLDVARDSIVSIGGLRMHGATMYRGATIDRLVNPGRPIPPHATAVHGITDDMVAAAGSFDAVWKELDGLMRGTVLVGHNVGFDIAHLARAATEAGIDWTPPAYLCTYLLVGALLPALPSLSLDAVASEFGVPVRGRHTALGDCLATGAVLARLLPRLDEAGVRTLGDAINFSSRRRELVERQRRAGWWVAKRR